MNGARTYRPVSVLLLFSFVLLGVGVWLSKESIGHLISGHPWILPSRQDPSGSRVVSGIEVAVYGVLAAGFLSAGIYTFFVWIGNSVALLGDRLIVRSMGKVILSAPYAELAQVPQFTSRNGI